MSTFAEYRAMRLPQPLQFGLEDIEAAVQDHVAIIQLQAEGFRAHSRGSVSTAPVQTLGQQPLRPFLGGPEAQTCVKSGYVEGDEHYVIKVAPGGVRANEEQGLPVNTGLNLLFSQRTTRLEAIFFDEGLLTEIRTAAAAALAAQVLAPRGEELKMVGMLGSGIQARWQLRLLKSVVSCRTALVHSRDPERAARFCQDMADEGWTVSVASAEEIAASCQLIHTATPARSPVLSCAWLPQGAACHISAMGSDSPGKRELEPALVAAADLLVCDSRAQTFERGELQGVVAEGLVQEDDVLELGDVLDRPDLHRQPGDSRLTIFDSSGIAVQDIMITKMVYQALSIPRSNL